MTNLKRPRNLHKTSLALIGVSLAAATMLAGCGEDPPPPAPVVRKAPPPPPPPPPPAPTTTSISDLMAQFNIDPRINMTEDTAPETDEERIAVLLFFDAFVRGNDGKLGDMLSEPDRFQLELMVKNGSFAKSIEKVEMIDIQTGMSPMGDSVALGIFMVDTDFQPTLWAYQIDGDPERGEVSFDAQPTPPNLMNRVSGDNLIQAWYQILGEEMARAEEMDEEIEIPSQDFTDTEETKSSTSGGGPGGPGGGGGAPGRRKPTGPVVDPNGPFNPGGN